MLLQLFPNSRLCYMCRHLLNKYWIFKSICVQRILEDPTIYGEIDIFKYQENKAHIYTLCTEDTCSENQFECINNDYYYQHNDDENNDTGNVQEVNDNVSNSLDSVTVELQDIPSDDGDKSCGDNVVISNDLTEDNETILKSKKKKSKKKKKDFEKIFLSLEEQKAELERNRRQKKYIEAEFKCYNCALGFLFKDTYQAHMMRHEESNGEFRCETCTLRFASARVLRVHAAAHAARMRCRRCARARPRRACDCGPAPRPPADHDPRACHLCGAVFREASGLQQHLRRYHQAAASQRSYSCSVCGKSYANQAAVRTHMITHIRRKFNCDQCSSIFSSPYTLKQHMKKHQPGEATMFFCETCSVSYTSKKSLLAHRRNSINHQQSVPECPVCGKICPNQRSLSSHIASVHSSEKSYWCPRCPARYSTRKSLVRHVRCHDAPEQHQVAVCHLCGLSFKGKSKLNRHLREVCEKQKLEDELTSYYDQEDIIN
ncbi:zinc finger protein 425-like isoform X2 [Galleria mellonella]|uniref:Zinc finger protein 425-like isoform X2 n=1 Tax=Galleria mellonella TaxID=7137 RepID=A0ABM3MBF0_GALME|nr:zinc finger protein 425-like isoform X2 [Galleria mellonella]